MAKVAIVDSAFMGLALSASLGGDNTGEEPEFVKWHRRFSEGETIFFTDGQIKTVRKFGRSERNVAWILEPHGLHPEPYQDALEFEEYFGTVLTSDTRYTHREKWRFYPFGGSWIHPGHWGLHKKSRVCSILASNKKTTKGHQLRHAVRDRFYDQLEVFGFARRASKLEALGPFMYSIIIESCKQSDYFTEKLIDCICFGTVPIYWGSPRLNVRFDMRGIITFQNIDELDEILPSLSRKDYAERLPAISRNMEQAKKYRCTEDWIFRMHPDLFS